MRFSPQFYNRYVAGSSSVVNSDAEMQHNQQEFFHIFRFFKLW